MKIRSLTIIMCSALFTVSCASKKLSVDEGQKQAKKEPAKKVLVKNDKEAEAYTCLVAGDRRIITLDRKEKRCEVSYTKFGKKEQMAWGESHPKICDDVFTNIRSNIEKRGFKCEDGLASKKEERKTASAN